MGVSWLGGSGLSVVVCCPGKGGSVVGIGGCASMVGSGMIEGTRFGLCKDASGGTAVLILNEFQEEETEETNALSSKGRMRTLSGP